MRSGWRGLLGGVAGALLLAGVGCGSGDSTDPGTIGSDDTQTHADEALRRRRPAPPPSTGSGGTSGSGTSAGGLTTEQVIAAAQTPDGRAIPQPAGPNHTCPEVVVRLGFWSCVTIGDTCASGGRSCTCSRTDGEGQLPSWICN
jgi:hypothetical protein